MPAADSSTEDTLDLKLPPDMAAFLAAIPPGSPGPVGPSKTNGPSEPPGACEPSRPAGPPVPSSGPDRSGRWGRPADLLDHVADWPAADTRAGRFQLVPVRLERDLALLSGWMNDPAVAAFWELAGHPHTTERHVSAQLTGDGRSLPCLGLLDGAPMSYWEIYRADLDPLARHYPARPQDTGIHLLIGGAADRARGLGGELLRAVSGLVLDNRPACTRVVAEPDLRNIPSVAAFLSAGFRFGAEIDLPDKRAALMVRDRALRHLL